MTTSEVMYAEQAYIALTKLLSVTGDDRFGTASPTDDPAFIRRRVKATVIELVKWYSKVSEKIDVKPLTIRADPSTIVKTRTPVGQIPFSRSGD